MTGFAIPVDELSLDVGRGIDNRAVAHDSVHGLGDNPTRAIQQETTDAERALPCRLFGQGDCVRCRFLGRVYRRATGANSRRQVKHMTVHPIPFGRFRGGTTYRVSRDQAWAQVRPVSPRPCPVRLQARTPAQPFAKYRGPRLRDRM